ncbi:VCBS repeat-containing protein, partial [bacterium]|nr:VCBS repeat-containing protein [candidate division CSSED10-310 bacterium]
GRVAPLETTPAWMSTEEYAVGGLRWADMNQDGLLDLVSVHYEGGFPVRPEETRIWFNDGGMLAATAGFVSADAIWSTDLALGDIDANGFPDIYVVNWGANVIHFQDAMGMPAAPSWSSTESLFSLVAAVGDVTGTGFCDIGVVNQGVSPDPYKPNHLYTNTTGIPGTSAAWISGDLAQHMACDFGDYDEDGVIDVNVTRVGNGTATLFNLGGSPVHSVGSITVDGIPQEHYAASLRGGWILLPDPPAPGASVVIACERSTDLDLAVAVDHGNAKVYHDIGTTLETLPSFTVSGSGDRREKAAAWIDVDTDGDLDLFVGGRSIPSMLYVNDNGILNASSAWSSTDPEPGVSDVDWIDMDLDGDLDIACSSTGDTNFDTLWVHENIDGALETDPSWVLPYGHASSMCNTAAWGDMNGDGYPDLAAGYAGAEIRVFLNTGSQTVPTPTPTLTSTPTPECNQDGDVNQDQAITAEDAQMAFMIALGSYSPNWLEWCAADCNGDWDVTAGDAQQVFLTALGSAACVDPINGIFSFPGRSR